MMADAGAALRDLTGRCGALGTALASRAGLLLYADLPVATLADTFAIMCATILGAAATTAVELGRAPPSRVTVEGADGVTIIVPVGPGALLATISGRHSDLARVSGEVEAFATFLATRTVTPVGRQRRADP